MPIFFSTAPRRTYTDTQDLSSSQCVSAGARTTFIAAYGTNHSRTLGTIPNEIWSVNRGPDTTFIALMNLRHSAGTGYPMLCVSVAEEQLRVVLDAHHRAPAVFACHTLSHYHCSIIHSLLVLSVALRTFEFGGSERSGPQLRGSTMSEHFP